MLSLRIEPHGDLSHPSESMSYIGKFELLNETIIFIQMGMKIPCPIFVQS